MVRALEHLIKRLLAVWPKGLLAALVLALGVPAASAHELSMAELQLRELRHGQYLLQWGAGEKRAPADTLHIEWPDGCRMAAQQLDCGEDGLKGKVTVQGVGEQFSVVMLKVYWRKGGDSVFTLTGSQPSAQLFGGPEDRRSAFEIGHAYLVLGIEHILSGIDHLLFVLSLLFLVGFRRQLLYTITAFTAAHSITLALSALGWLSLRSAPVEASIALSIVMVAAEALRQRDTLARRVPAAVAFGFGLVHGLGFAGALREIGLPEQHLSTALLSFNLGVETGQLAVVGVVWGLHNLLRRQPWWPLWRRPALYGIGVVAAYWSWGRVLAIVA